MSIQNIKIVFLSTAVIFNLNTFGMEKEGLPEINLDSNTSQNTTNSPQSPRNKNPEFEFNEQKQPKPNQNDTFPQGNINVNQAQNINNFHKPIMVMPDVAGTHELDAKAEGISRGIREEAQEQAYMREALKNRKAKEDFIDMQAELAARKQIATQKLLTTLKADTLDDEKKAAAMEADISVYKKHYIITKYQDTLMASALEEAKVIAAKTVEAEKYLNEHHPDRQFKAQLIAALKNTALKLIQVGIIKASDVAINVGVSAAFELFINLPHPFCRQLKEARERSEQIQAVKNIDAKQKQEKLVTQEALQKDITLLNLCWQQIQQAKEMANNTQDPEEKNERKEICNQLEDQHFQTLTNLTAMIQLNLKNQPHMQSLLAEQKKRYQKMKEAAAQQMQAAMEQAAKQNQQQNTMSALPKMPMHAASAGQMPQ